MLEEVFFFETVRAAATGLPMVEQVEACDEPLLVNIRILDFLSAGDEPWIVQAQQIADFVHPLFGERYACIELLLPLMIIRPEVPGYLDVVAAHAATCLDHQRFCFGASATWAPDTGQLAIQGQLRLEELAQAALTRQLRGRLRDVIALTYLISFRIWQLRLRRRVPEETSNPLVEEAHGRMLALLGASPPGMRA